MKTYTMTAIQGYVALVLVGLLCVCVSAHAEPNDLTLKHDSSMLIPLSTDVLRNETGGFALTQGPTASNYSLVSGNSINGNVGLTGEINGLSAQGISGVATLIANSGNQVSITESTTVNIYLH